MHKVSNIARAVLHNTWILLDTTVYASFGLGLAAWTAIGNRITKLIKAPPHSIGSIDD